jgi:large-conductance mechanosensitive channel
MSSKTNMDINAYNIILFIGLGVGFGTSLKSLIDSFVFNTIEPLILLSLPTSKNSTRSTQLIHFVSNIISFIIIILIILYTIKNY